VLRQAEDEGNPLLERVKFLAITGSNLDDFFMKRIGGLKRQVAAGVAEPTVDGRTPQQQIAECSAFVRQFVVERVACERQLLKLLAENDIRILRLGPAECTTQAQLREYYLRDIFPLVTPLAFDPAHPFVFVSNLSLNLLVTGQALDRSELIVARVTVRVGEGIPRFVRIGEAAHLVRLEEVMAHTLDVVPRTVRDFMRAVSRHAQREHRTRRGRGGRAAAQHRSRRRSTTTRHLRIPGPRGSSESGPALLRACRSVPRPLRGLVRSP